MPQALRELWPDWTDGKSPCCPCQLFLGMQVQTCRALEHWDGGHGVPLWLRAVVQEALQRCTSCTSSPCCTTNLRLHSASGDA